MYRVPPYTFCAGSYAFVTPRPAAVPGINCMRPCAPTFEVAFALNPDSLAMIALTSAGSTFHCDALVLHELVDLRRGHHRRRVDRADGRTGGNTRDRVSVGLLLVLCGKFGPYHVGKGRGLVVLPAASRAVRRSIR